VNSRSVVSASGSQELQSDSASWWARELFLSPDFEGGICPAVLDVTGRARYLFFGPYIELSSGIWRAEVRFRLCPDASRCRLAVQFGVEPDYTTIDVPFGVPGPHAVRIEHKQSVAGLAQIRLWLKKAAFHGEVRFTGASVSRIGDCNTDASS
jgi:hypothetical protein